MLMAIPTPYNKDFSKHTRCRNSPGVLLSLRNSQGVKKPSGEAI